MTVSDVHDTQLREPRTRHAEAVTLLGPQRPRDGSHREGEQLRDLLRADGITGRVALVTAGWQERESEDAALVETLGVPCINLRLHERSEAVFAEDLELARAYKARQERLRHMQSFYRTRLEAADDAAHAIAVRHVDESLLSEELGVSIDVFRQLDHDHVERCAKVSGDFERHWVPVTRTAVARHWRELEETLGDCQALFIAGGHVASLYNRMRLFDVMGLASRLPIYASSAGAMVLTDRIVCFHDHPPYGKDIAQVLDKGFGLVSDMVVLPDPRRRVKLLDVRGISRFSRRMAPAWCVALDVGHHVRLLPHRATTGQAWRLMPDGRIDTGWTGHPGHARAHEDEAQHRGHHAERQRP
ncbi:MAG TPA: hypothetical protein PK095_20015 [Myxococcota bacterium]|nr:hypothetical protein [Myxococcota bacterium]